MSLSLYSKGSNLGEGTWGQVFEASRKVDGHHVAIKRIKPIFTDSHLPPGINFTAIREIKYLQELKGPNIVNVFIDEGVLHLVLEFCPFDLEKVIRDKSIFLKSAHCKSYLQMILKGIDACHKSFILHRDMKPANLLIGKDGQIKIADFGLARSHASPENMTSEVVTRWYRPPELLFGAQSYSSGVDIWAIGCIFAEIILRVPLFPGDSDVEQLGKIFNVLGTPKLSEWPDVDLLSNYMEFEPREPLELSSLFGDKADANNSKLNLLLNMLTLNPKNRITAAEALLHPYFSDNPIPTFPSELPVPSSVNNSIAADLLPDAKRPKLA